MARNLCFPGTMSYGWISPNGEVHAISEGTHSEWAFLHVTPIKDRPDILHRKVEGPEDLKELRRLEEMEGNALLQLLEEGWIRMSNAYELDADSSARKKAWEAALRLTIGCVLSKHEDPFSTRMHIYVNGSGGSTTVDKAVHKYAPQLESLLYSSTRQVPSPQRVVHAFLQGNFYIFAKGPLEEELKKPFDWLDSTNAKSAVFYVKDQKAYTGFLQNLSSDSFAKSSANYIYKISGVNNIFDGSPGDCRRVLLASPESVSAIKASRPTLLDAGTDEIATFVSDLLLKSGLPDPRWILSALKVDFQTFRKLYNGVSLPNLGTLVFREIAASAVLVDGTVMRTSPGDKQDVIFEFPKWVEEELHRYTKDPNKRLNPQVVLWLKENAPKPYSSVRVYRGFSVELHGKSIQEINKTLFKRTGLKTLDQVRIGAKILVKRGKESSWSTSAQVASNFAQADTLDLSVLVKADIPAEQVILDFNQLPMAIRRKFDFHGQGEVIVDTGNLSATIVKILVLDKAIPPEALVKFIPRVGIVPAS